MSLRAFAIALLVLPLPAAAQTVAPRTETFDIATFVRPPGWSRSESDGVLILSYAKIQPGQPHALACVIYLYPSRPSTAAPALEFQREWQATVGRSFGVSQHTPPEIQTSPDGWTALIARADIVAQGGIPVRTILVTSIGFGRLMSSMVYTSPDSCTAEIDDFFQRMDLHVTGIPQRPRPPIAPPNQPPATAEATVPNTGSSDSLSRYVYTPPPGWVRQNAQDGIVLAPAQFTGERCQIQMFAPRRVSGSLADLALGAFRSTFSDDPLQSYPSPAKWLVRGTSPEGWEYFEIKKLVGGQEGDGRGFGTILLLVRLDDTVVTILGTSKDFMVSNCFGELQTNVWPAFFYSLHFKGVRPSSAAQDAVRQQLAGTWILATANVGLSYVFRSDGRYATSNRADYLTTSKYFGNGMYSLEDNKIVLVGDDHSRTVQSFRLQQVSHNGGRSWEDQLCMMAAGNGELCYQRDR